MRKIHGNMQIYIADSYEEMSRQAAYLLAGQIRLNPRSVIGLATGDTPTGMYGELIRMNKEENLDFSEITTFNLDEYYPIEKDNSQSYYYYMMKNLFEHINIPKDGIHIPNGTAEDVKQECLSYEKNIAEKGNIDLQVLGIGPNGHIGFNEPDVKFEAITHLVALDEKTINANARFFNSIEEVPKKAISMGIKTIMQSRKILLLVSGKKKAKVIREAIYGEITPELPASILQLHPNVTVIMDNEAAIDL